MLFLSRKTFSTQTVLCLDFFLFSLRYFHKMQKRTLLLLFFCSLFLFFNYLQQYTFSISNAFVRNTAMKMEKKKKKQKLSNTLRLKFCYLNIICFLHLSFFIHPCYHRNIIGHIVKNLQKNKCFCFNEII